MINIWQLKIRRVCLQESAYSVCFFEYHNPCLKDNTEISLQPLCSYGLHNFPFIISYVIKKTKSLSYHCVGIYVVIYLNT